MIKVDNKRTQHLQMLQWANSHLSPNIVFLLQVEQDLAPTFMEMFKPQSLMLTVDGLRIET